MIFLSRSFSAVLLHIYLFFFWCVRQTDNFLSYTHKSNEKAKTYFPFHLTKLYIDIFNVFFYCFFWNYWEPKLNQTKLAFCGHYYGPIYEYRIFFVMAESRFGGENDDMTQQRKLNVFLCPNHITKSNCKEIETNSTISFLLIR